jgi:hypothetical protein
MNKQETGYWQLLGNGLKVILRFGWITHPITELLGTMILFSTATAFLTVYSSLLWIIATLPGLIIGMSHSFYREWKRGG